MKWTKRQKVMNLLSRLCTWVTSFVDIVDSLVVIFSLTYWYHSYGMRMRKFTYSKILLPVDRRLRVAEEVEQKRKRNAVRE